MGGRGKEGEGGGDGGGGGEMWRGREREGGRGGEVREMGEEVERHGEREGGREGGRVQNIIITASPLLEFYTISNIWDDTSSKQSTYLS